MAKSVIIELDFTAVNGAELLFNTAKELLMKIDNIELDAPSEARYLQGKDYQEGLQAYFTAIKTKKTAQKAAKDLTVAWGSALDKAISEAATPAFKSFVASLVDKNITVVLATRAETEKVSEVFADILSDKVHVYQDTGTSYGGPKWDMWRRAAHAAKVPYASALALTGSGTGVKAALRAGMGSIAVMNPHVAYQDFTGADEIVTALDKNAAKKIFATLRV